MSDEETKVSNPTSPKYNGVDVDHPTIVEYGRNMKRQGVSVEQAAKRLGVPHEVADRIYRNTPER
jgi:hypothetical protein